MIRTTRRARPGVRVGFGIAVWLAAVAAAWLVSPRLPLVVTVPAITVAALATAMVVRASAPRVIAAATATAAVVSLSGALGWLLSARVESGAWVYLQTLALLLLIAMATRHCPLGTAMPVVAPAVVADAALALPILGPQLPADQWPGMCLFWSIGAAGAIGFGFYLRALDVRAATAVAEARRVQRRQLARDLHDFVAHDVSAMVIQAQAAQVVLESDPSRAATALRRIETDGTRALDSMDRSIKLLHDNDSDTADGGLAPVPGVAELTALVDRFASDRTGDVTLRLDCEPDAIPRDIGAAIYRVTVETLTNVRRHAGPRARVGIDVRLAAEAGRRLVVCVVTNSTAPGDGASPATSDRGGLGLTALAEQVKVLGGGFTAGPNGDSTWTVRAILPLAETP